MTATLRDYLKANMFDGCDEGMVTMHTGRLLDEVCELVARYLIAVSGAEGAVADYYSEPFA